jgi:hypothetical protein
MRVPGPVEPIGVFLWAVNMIVGVLSPIALCGLTSL